MSERRSIMKKALCFIFMVTAACSTAKTTASTDAQISGIQGLSWGLNFPASATIPDQQLKSAIGSVLKQASLNLEENPSVSAIPEFQKEGILDSNQRYIQSDLAEKGLEVLLRWSLCAKLSDSETLRGKCRQKAQVGIQDWAATYRTDGNPYQRQQSSPFAVRDRCREIANDVGSVGSGSFLAAESYLGRG